MRYTIPLSYNPIHVDRLADTLKRYQGQHHNQLIIDFETAMCRVTSSPYAVALNSGTAAIHLALKVLGITSDDYVLAPTFTYVATINPIRYLGANPVLIDSERITWNMDPDLVEEAIEKLKAEGKKPKAMVVVHTYGMPSQLDRLLEIANRESLAVLEDAAESLRSSYRGQIVGTLGDVGVYSFNNNKVVTAYGGGVLVTKNEKWASKVRFWANQSREDLPYYDHHETGFNYAMGPLNAAAGLTQLTDLQDYVNIRRTHADSYRSALAEMEISFQTEMPDMYANRWFSTCLFPNEATRNRVGSVLEANGIETRPLWRPMHQQPVFSPFESINRGVAEDYFRRGICLPSGNALTPADREKVIRLVKATL